MADRDNLTWTLTTTELETILGYTIHRPDCQLVVERHNKRAACTCRLATALAALYREQARHQTAGGLQPGDHVISNANIFGGRSIPQWLLDLVPARRTVIKDTMNIPGPMSDG